MKDNELNPPTYFRERIKATLFALGALLALFLEAVMDMGFEAALDGFRYMAMVLAFLIVSSDLTKGIDERIRHKRENK